MERAVFTRVDAALRRVKLTQTSCFSANNNVPDDAPQLLDCQIEGKRDEGIGRRRVRLESVNTG
jgi:hypothetical protein